MTSNINDCIKTIISRTKSIENIHEYIDDLTTKLHNGDNYSDGLLLKKIKEAKTFVSECEKDLDKLKIKYLKLVSKI